MSILICDNCAKTARLASCFNSLTIGTMANASTAYRIQFTPLIGNEPSPFYMTATSDIAGLLVLTINEEVSRNNFVATYPFRVAVLPLNMTDEEDYQAITIDEVEYECFVVEFDPLNSTDEQVIRVI